MKTIIELIPLVEKWAEERQIFEKSNSTKQLEKTREEVDELIRDLKDPVKKFDFIEKSVRKAFKELCLYCKIVGIDISPILKKELNKYSKKRQMSSREIYKKINKDFTNVESVNLNNISSLLCCLIHTSEYINKKLY